MASIPGAVPVGGFFAPTDSTDTYPVTDPTWGLGGLRTVANIAERDAITTARREEGMAVYVISETKRYVLEGGITNAHWVHDFSGGVTELSDLTDVNTSGALEDQVLAYDAYTGLWTPATISAGASVLDDLTDVSSSGATDGQVLSYNSSTGTWSPTNISSSIVAALDDLTDVSTSGATQDQVLAYNSSSGTWTPASISTGVSYLSDLLDVNTVGATQDQVLSYNSSSGTWTPATISIPSVPTVLSDLTDTDTSGATQDQVLAYNASSGLWTPATISTPTVPTVLSDLTDVDTSGATQDQFLSYNVSTGVWTPTSVTPGGVSALSDLTDVDTSGALEDQVLAYNSSTGTWTPATISGGSSYLNDLLDVDTSGATQNQVIAYDVSSATWRAATATAISESFATTFSGSSISLSDGQNFSLVESTLFTTRGIGQELIFTSAASSGQVTIELYQDSGRTEKVYEHVVDLSDSSTYKDYETFGFTNATTGTLYGTLYCSGVAGGSTGNIEVTASIIAPTGSPTPAPSPYGDGIEDDGTGKPQVALATQSGLAFTAGDLYVRGDNTQPVYTQRTANGLYVTGAVDITTNQTITGNKMFNSVGLTPLAYAGPPTSGTYSVGAESIDANNVKWRCYSSGSPGSWELADNVVEETPVYSTTVASVTYGNIVNVDMDVTGNAGNCMWFRVWARRSSGTSAMQIPFRVRIYETTDYNGREIVWQGLGLARQVPITSTLNPSIEDISADNSYIDIDEGLVVYESDSRFEFARCSSRITAAITIDEALVDPYPWSSATTSVLMVSEWNNVPWYNTDGNPLNRNKILVEIRHDGQAGDPDLVFYVQALAMNMGVLR